MYHPTELANALTPTSWFYSLYLHTPESYNDNYHSSRLEISFLLDSVASIPVLNTLPISQLQNFSISHVIIKEIILQKRCLLQTRLKFSFTLCNYYLKYDRTNLQTVHYPICCCRFRI